MKLLKKINNNYALALDSKGEQIIVEGKGIGFLKMPCELSDLSRISRTYYNTKEQDISLIQSVSDKVLHIASEVSIYAGIQIAERLNPNLTFILADHIQFSIERFENKINIKMPIYYDVKLLYPKETEIAEYALKLIREELKIALPDSEITGLALNIINSEIIPENANENREEIIETISAYIENFFDIKLNRDSFCYSRLVSHIEYLLKRAKENVDISLEDKELYLSVKKEIPKVSKCVNDIELIFNVNGYFLNEEEKMYLMLHINRLYNRKGL